MQAYTQVHDRCHTHLPPVAATSSRMSTNFHYTSIYFLHPKLVMVVFNFTKYIDFTVHLDVIIYLARFIEKKYACIYNKIRIRSGRRICQYK